MLRPCQGADQCADHPFALASPAVEPALCAHGDRPPVGALFAVAAPVVIGTSLLSFESGCRWWSTLSAACRRRGATRSEHPHRGVLITGSHAFAASMVSVVPVVGNPVAAAWTEITLQRLKRAVEELTSAVEDAAQDRGIRIEARFEEIAQQTDVRTLFASGADTVALSEDERLRRIAGRLLKEGLTDSAAVDESRLLLANASST